MAGGTVAQSVSFKVLSITGLYSRETLKKEEPVMSREMYTQHSCAFEKL